MSAATTTSLLFSATLTMINEARLPLDQRRYKVPSGALYEIPSVTWDRRSSTSAGLCRIETASMIWPRPFP